jgi:hypothetical protein
MKCKNGKTQLQKSTHKCENDLKKLESTIPTSKLQHLDLYNYDMKLEVKCSVASYGTRAVRLRFQFPTNGNITHSILLSLLHFSVVH